MRPKHSSAATVRSAVAMAAVLLAALHGELRGADAKPPAMARPFEASTVVAHVDGRAITLGEVMFSFAQLPDRAKDSYTRDPQGLRRFLDDYLANLAFSREAEARKLDADPLFARLMTIKREEVLREVLARRTVLAGISEETLHARYQASIERFTVRPAVHLRYILVTPVRETTPPNSTGDDAVGEEAARLKAEKLRAEILATSRFALVAERSSEDASAKVGGDLGWVEPDALVAELRQPVLTLPPGTPSPVIKSTLGYHIVEVIERRSAGTLPFETVHELLFQEMISDQRAENERAAEKERAALVSRHKVEVHANRLPW